MKKMYYLLLLLILPFLYFFKKGEKTQFLKGAKLRGCDKQGCGHFGASRINHKHKGLDIAKKVGEVVKAPFDCQIIRVGYPYADGSNYLLVEIQGVHKFADYTAKIMYVKDIADISTKVYKQGEKIAVADDITLRYSGIKNHVHFELYKKGRLINPEIFL